METSKRTRLVTMPAHAASCLDFPVIRGTAAPGALYPHDVQKIGCSIARMGETLLFSAALSVSPHQGIGALTPRLDIRNCLEAAQRAAYRRYGLFLYRMCFGYFGNPRLLEDTTNRHHLSYLGLPPCLCGPVASFPIIAPLCCFAYVPRYTEPFALYRSFTAAIASSALMV
jgi:hypothetical protein